MPGLSAWRLRSGYAHGRFDMGGITARNYDVRIDWLTFALYFQRGNPFYGVQAEHEHHKDIGSEDLILNLNLKADSGRLSSLLRIRTSAAGGTSRTDRQTDSSPLEKRRTLDRTGTDGVSFVDAS